LEPPELALFVVPVSAELFNGARLSGYGGNFFRTTLPTSTVLPLTVTSFEHPGACGIV
jgi:hypothetical protein